MKKNGTSVKKQVKAKKIISLLIVKCRISEGEAPGQLRLPFRLGQQVKCQCGSQVERGIPGQLHPAIVVYTTGTFVKISTGIHLSNR